MAPSPPRNDDRGENTQPDVQSRVRAGLIDIAPILFFTLTFALTHRVLIAVAFALTCGIGITVGRLVRREPVWRALGALGIICLGGLLASRTGDAANFFAPGLVIHSTIALVTPVMLAFGWPPLGLVAGLVTGEGTGWRRCPIRRRAFTRSNVVLLAAKVVILSAEIPLFLAGRTVALGFTNAVGPAVHGLGVLLAWRVFRRTTGTHRCAPGKTAAAAPDLSSSPDPQKAA
ncbi:Protein of unknown function [Saccharopolyspora antimicrobica]|uniref:Uncharacterized protein DUF3159 n=1 Tax=Saccharopolyspora antimicrobica TaxID=455193 RepID=A0A1I5GQU2_9PSEU|nr:DUF3159 domain-containing protein [Saccharopolyspora antimicrobica]RKT87400.1 uncharacterized protein DUF3159 [Saccharopolyspora antimicrobica]SFO38362.1 Protein of unknown function [Saccharopolyspora antimicrobica]